MGLVQTPAASHYAAAVTSQLFSSKIYAVAESISKSVSSACIALAFLLGACGSAPARVAPKPAEPLPPLPPLPLLVPRGAKEIVIANPHSLAAHGSIQKVIDAVNGGVGLARFGDRWQVDVLATEQVVLATYSSGWILLAQLESHARDVVDAAAARMFGIVESESDPLYRRVGILGRDHYTFAALREHVLMVAQGAVDEPCHALLHFAREDRWPNGSTALLESLAALTLSTSTGPEQSDAAKLPLAILVPRHLDLPPGHAVSILLARQTGLLAHLEPIGERLRVRIVLTGQFPPGAPANFRALGRSLAHSELGKALGVYEALSSLSVNERADGILVELDISAQILAHGLQLFFVAEMEELFARSALLAPSPTLAQHPTIKRQLARLTH